MSMSDYKSPLLQKPDYLVCTCMAVMYHDIVRAIEAGHTTFETLQETLLIGTGCSSCVEEIHHILRECEKP
jgi:bacterioferritin-associated ferredoxin